MSRFGLVIPYVALLAACGEPYNRAGQALPQAEISTSRLDFGALDWGETVFKDVAITNRGALPLGIASIAIGTNEMEENFTLHLAPSVDCDGEGTTDNSPPSSGDEGDDGGDEGGDDTGIDTNDGHTPDSDDASSSNALRKTMVVEPDCTYRFQVSATPSSVGQIYGSIIVDYATESGSDPSYYRDPDRFRETVLLQATAEKGNGNIVVSPRTLDFGHPSAGIDMQRYIEVYNVGAGPLQLERPETDAACDERFVFDFGRLETGTTLDGRTSTLIPVQYLGTSLGRAECEMTIASSDLDTPSSRVSLRAQVGTNPLCTPPTLNLISPEPGMVHGAAEGLTLTMQIADAEQSPTTLYCSVHTSFNPDEEVDELANCTPTEESGYTVATVPNSMLMVGTDTLVITVQDSCGLETSASVSVLFNSAHPPSDDDGDGFADGPVEHVDCDDTDPWVYPNATERFDGKDNDCDGIIDEGTDGMDDDGDGFSEEEGDCNDYDDTVFPDAPEQSDTKDNDCNGIVDDKTGLYDDDGDGFAETDNDCNDNNSEIHPAATEYCDGIDNNCNGLKDDRDGCIEIDAAPIILGEIQMEATALGAGESTIMSLDVYDADGTELVFAWQEDPLLLEAGHNGFDSVTTQTVTWTAPSSLSSSSPGEVYTLYVVVTDPEGQTDWAFGEITVYPDPVAMALGAIEAEESGCGSDDDDASSAAIVAPLLLLAIGLRRRRE